MELIKRNNKGDINMSYKTDERTKFIIETETKAIIDTLEKLNDRHIYIGGTVYDLLEIEDEEKCEKLTTYIQNEIIKNVKKHSEFKEFNNIFK